MDLQNFALEIENFLEFVDRVYGLYLDAILGFEENYRQTIERQNRAIARAAQQGVLLMPEEIDQGPMEYVSNSSGGFPHLQHTTTIGVFKARNGGIGSNAAFFATLCVSTIYNYWQDHHRQRVATFLGLQKDDVTIPIMGDLRHYRRAIVHCKGIAIKEMERCAEIKWFKEGEYINLNTFQMDEIIQRVNDGLRSYRDQMIKKYDEATRPSL